MYNKKNTNTRKKMQKKTNKCKKKWNGGNPYNYPKAYYVHQLHDLFLKLRNIELLTFEDYTTLTHLDIYSLSNPQLEELIGNIQSLKTQYTNYLQDKEYISHENLRSVVDSFNNELGKQMQKAVTLSQKNFAKKRDSSDTFFSSNSSRKMPRHF